MVNAQTRAHTIYGMVYRRPLCILGVVRTGLSNNLHHGTLSRADVYSSHPLQNPFESQRPRTCCSICQGLTAEYCDWNLDHTEDVGAYGRSWQWSLTGMRRCLLVVSYLL